MASDKRRHGFERVDEASNPSAWVETLDLLHEEPFYREYKARVRDLLRPESSGLYLEVGAGVGTDSLALDARVVGVDRSLTMCSEARMRGLPALVADAEAIPLASDSVDGCWSDRTVQHLPNPEKALGEFVRVTKPGGIVVVVDPDYGTQNLAFPDQVLARKVLAYRERHMIRNATLAHRMGVLFDRASLEDVAIEARTLEVRDPTSLDNVLGLRSWASAAAGAGFMSDEEVALWLKEYDEVVASGSFLWSVTFFITSGTNRP
jgi:SAM-dependent methyltransferase